MTAKKQHEWRITLIRKKGEFVGTVEAPDRESAIKAAIEEFDVKDPEQQRQLVAQGVA